MLDQETAQEFRRAVAKRLVTMPTALLKRVSDCVDEMAELERLSADNRCSSELIGIRVRNRFVAKTIKA